MLNNLNEEKRSTLVSRSRSNARFNRSKNVSIITIPHSFDNIDMNKLFKKDIMDIKLAINGETDDYEVIISFSSFLENLKENVSNNVQVQQTKQLNLNIILKSLKKAFDTQDVYIHCNCLHPQTPIKLLDGRTLTIEKLCQEFENNDKQLYVYSADEKGDFVPGEIEKVWKTKETTHFIKVTLDNGQEILTTPEHLYRLRDGSYLPAAELKVNQSLMALYFNETNGYENVKTNSQPNGKYKSVYKIVANKYYSNEIERIKKEVIGTENNRGLAIHHIDYNKKNNTPENLKPMGDRQHYLFHANFVSDRWKNDPEFVKKNKESGSKFITELNKNPTQAMYDAKHSAQLVEKLRAYYQTEEGKAFMRHKSETIGIKFKQYWESLTEQQKQEIYNKISVASKNAWERGCFDTQKFHNARNEAGKKGAQLFRTQEHKQLTLQKQREYWENLTEEDRIVLSKNRSNIVKRLWENDREKFLTPKAIQVRQNNCKRIGSNPEYVSIIAKKKIKTVIDKMLSQGIIISFENYTAYIRQYKMHYPNIRRWFKDEEELIIYYGLNNNYNHKIVNIEIVNLDKPIPVYDIKVRTYENFLVGQGVILHNCPDAKYRFAYWQTVKKFNSGQPELRFPKITNPNDSLGSGCKHAILVLKNNFWLIKVANVINNYIKTIQKQYKKLYDTVIYPAIFGDVDTNTTKTQTRSTIETTKTQSDINSKKDADNEDNT